MFCGRGLQLKGHSGPLFNLAKRGGPQSTKINTKKLYRSTQIKEIWFYLAKEIHTAIHKIMQNRNYLLVLDVWHRFAATRESMFGLILRWFVFLAQHGNARQSNVYGGQIYLFSFLKKIEQHIKHRALSLELQTKRSSSHFWRISCFSEHFLFSNIAHW